MRAPRQRAAPSPAARPTTNFSTSLTIILLAAASERGACLFLEVGLGLLHGILALQVGHHLILRQREALLHGLLALPALSVRLALHKTCRWGLLVPVPPAKHTADSAKTADDSTVSALAKALAVRLAFTKHKVNGCLSPHHLIIKMVLTQQNFPEKKHSSIKVEYCLLCRFFAADIQV